MYLCIMYVCMYDVCMSAGNNTTPTEVFSWNFTFEIFIKICRHCNFG